MKAIWRYYYAFVYFNCTFLLQFRFLFEFIQFFILLLWIRIQQ